LKNKKSLNEQYIKVLFTPLTLQLFIKKVGGLFISSIREELHSNQLDAFKYRENNQVKTLEAITVH
jgi:hypothetical protein